MTESYMTRKNIDDEKFILLDSIENVTEEKRNNAIDLPCQVIKEDGKHSDISLEESFKQVVHKKKKNIELIEAGNEFKVTSKTPSRLSHNFIQSWVNTGYLPYQTYVSDKEYSGIDSLNQKLSSCKICDIPNTVSIEKSNNKELCNSSSNCSSVDTAAYILSNTNVKKRTETIAIIVDTKCSSKIPFQNTLGENTFYEKDKTSIMCTQLNNVVDSNVSTSKSTLNISDASMMYMKNQRLEKNDEIKELKLQVSDTRDTNEIYENSKEDDFNFHNKEEFTQNLMEESVDASKSVNLSCEGSFINSKYFRQKKLYSGRDSPTDIIVARFKENYMNGTKKDLHPAFRNSPPIEKTRQKVLQKKRKTAFCLNNSMNQFFDISTSNDTGEDMHVAKRQKTLTDIPITSQSSVNKRLFISCNALKEQIKRFRTLDYVKVTRQFNRFAGKKSSEKKTKSNTSANTILHNALHENLSPRIILERLSEEILKYYTREKNTHIQSEELKENDQINNEEKDTQESNFETFSNDSNSTNFLPRLENINTDIVDSDVSTIIICNHNDITSSNTARSDCSTIVLNTSSNLLNSDKVDKNSDDIKLKRFQPVVALEKLQVQFDRQISNKIKQSKNSVNYQNMRRQKHNRSKQNSKDTSLIKRKQLKKRVNRNLSNIILDKTLQPIIVLERHIDPRQDGRYQNEMYNTLNNDSMHVTDSKEKYLSKLKNSDNKLLKKLSVKLERLSHLTITTHMNKLSGMHNSFDKKLNNSNKSVKSNKLNKVHVKKNNISTDNSSMDSTEETEKKKEHVRNSNCNKNLPLFRTSENYNSTSDSDSDSNSHVPFIQCIFNVYPERNQKQFSKKQSSRTERKRMLNCDTDDSISTRSRSNTSTNLSTRSKHSQQRMYDSNESILTSSRSNSVKNLSIVKSINSILNYSKTKDIQVNMIYPSNKQHGASTSSSMSSKNNSERNKSINENNKKTATNKDNIRRLTFCTKAYDSDSD